MTDQNEWCEKTLEIAEEIAEVVEGIDEKGLVNEEDRITLTMLTQGLLETQRAMNDQRIISETELLRRDKIIRKLV